MQISSFANNNFLGVVNKSDTKIIEAANSHKQNYLDLSASKKVDSFDYRVPETEIGTTYSPKDCLVENKMRMSEIQSSTYSSSSVSYYNVIVNRAAKMAGVSVGANGEPKINGEYDYKSYQAALTSIQGTFWCQTGGWSGLSGDGSTECARTASATMASINSGSIVTPNDTGAAMTSVTVDGSVYAISGGYAHNYSTVNGAAQGFHSYGFSSQSDLLSAINTELSQNRSVAVKVTTNTGVQHWVTVTGTQDGKPAESFSDLMGVDPWYNGNNTANGGSTGTGNGACTASKSGVIALSTTCSGFRYSQNDNYPAGYRMVTFNVDN